MAEPVDDFTSAAAAILKEAQAQPGQPSYTELAGLTGLSRPTVERVLNGRRDISLRYLRALCGALNLDPGSVVAQAAEGAPRIVEA